MLRVVHWDLPWLMSSAAQGEEAIQIDTNPPVQVHVTYVCLLFTSCMCMISYQTMSVHVISCHDQTRPVVKHVLSKEQQMYYEHVTGPFHDNM